MKLIFPDTYVRFVFLYLAGLWWAGIPINNQSNFICQKEEFDDGSLFHMLQFFKQMVSLGERRQNVIWIILTHVPLYGWKLLKNFKLGNIDTTSKNKSPKSQIAEVVKSPTRISRTFWIPQLPIYSARFDVTFKIILKFTKFNVILLNLQGRSGSYYRGNKEW